jgi:hypothetical protein
MIHSSKCPKCEQPIGHIKGEPIEIRVTTRDIYKGVSYCCPLCRSVLGVQMDPLAVNQNLLNQMRKG